MLREPGLRGVSPKSEVLNELILLYYYYITIKTRFEQKAHYDYVNSIVLVVKHSLCIL